MARDCLALGTPMITNYNDDLLALYPEMWPILRVNKRGDLLNHLKDISSWKKKDLISYKKKNKHWFNKYMDSKEVLKHLESKLRLEVLLFKNRKKVFYPFSLIGRNH